MKEYFAALCGIALISAASLALRAQEKSSTYKYKKDGLVYAELSKAPAKAQAKRNPMEKDPDAVPAGRNLFEQHCSECHGRSAEGTRKGPSLLEDPVQNAPPGAIFWVLTNGVVRRGMPVWSKLPEPQRWQLVTFLKSLGPAQATAEKPVAATSPPAPAKDSTSPHR